MSSSGKGLARTRNPRGAGIHLRAEIIDAARALLVETGSDAAVTLRAVARRVGIAAPSIYAHFDSPEQIVQAVVADTFTALRRRLDQARQRARGPGERVVANCRAYVAFGAEQPALYAVLFSHPRPPSGVSSANITGSGQDALAEAMDVIGDGRAGDLAGIEVFALLLQDVIDAIADGSSTADNALVTATELWTAMHGLVMLRATAPEFLLPDPDHLESDLIYRLAELSQPPGQRTG